MWFTFIPCMIFFSLLRLVRVKTADDRMLI